MRVGMGLDTNMAIHARKGSAHGLRKGLGKKGRTDSLRAPKTPDSSQLFSTPPHDATFSSSVAAAHAAARLLLRVSAAVTAAIAGRKDEHLVRSP
uniref:Uncharacterized protein n=1 Tax=Leersia perrieri TaxID=77586 RepID=A0A0D9WVZ9_9ORYZ